MKKALLAALTLCLVMAFAVGCASDDPEPEPIPEPEAPAVEEGFDTMSLQDFVDMQNAMFEGVNSDEISVFVAAEGTVLRYTYVIGSDEGRQEMIDMTKDEGEVMLSYTQDVIPELTAVILEFQDGDGNVLDSAEFN